MFILKPEDGWSLSYVLTQEGHHGGGEGTTGEQAAFAHVSAPHLQLLLLGVSSMGWESHV